MPSDPAPPAEAPEPGDRDTPASEELARGLRWLAADFARCLLAAAVIAFGFLVLTSPGPWPWAGIALAFVALSAAAVTAWFRSPLWISVVVGLFVLLSMMPRWLAPEPALTGGPVPLTIERQSGWVTAAIVAGLAAWLAMTVMERVQAIRRALGRGG
ncbi:MAG: hypothetical protein ACKOWF_05460 [Chloroflexota bacterium]